MSVEEDTELRDLVSKTLENNGVLAKIRAELRASVFLALEEQEANSAPFENKALKDYLKSPQAALGLCIVREFLEYLELDFTLSVYNTETSHGKGYEYCGRNKLIKDLQMKSLNGKKGPLLSHILQIAQESCGMCTDAKEEVSHNSPVNSKLTFPEGSLCHNISREDGTTLENTNVSLGPLDRTFTSDGPTVKGILTLLSENDDEGKNRGLEINHSPLEVDVCGKPTPKSKDNVEIGSLEELVNDENQPPKKSIFSKNASLNERKPSVEDNVQGKSVKTESKNSMSSLNDLPPLDVQGKRNFSSASSINFSGLGLHDDYEEDFHSTDSSAAADESSKNLSEQKNNHLGTHRKEKTTVGKLPMGNVDKESSDKVTNSPVGSISEDIDDNTNSGVDDLLNSTTSTENTVDSSISHIRSNFADYIQDI